MAIDILRRIGLFFVFVILQALVLGHIHLFDCATPLLYVYFAILLPRNFPRWASMVMCFLLGVCVDIFFNTPGVAMASMTFIGFVQPYILLLYLDRDDAEDFSPSVYTMGWLKYISYVFLIVSIYCIIFFSLEAFNFFNWLQWLMCVGGSFALTCLLIITIDIVRK